MFTCIAAGWHWLELSQVPSQSGVKLSPHWSPGFRVNKPINIKISLTLLFWMRIPLSFASENRWFTRSESFAKTCKKYIKVYNSI